MSYLSQEEVNEKNAQVESELQSSFLLLFVANRIICINE